MQKLTDVINKALVLWTMFQTNINQLSRVFVDTWSQLKKIRYVANNNGPRSNCNCPWFVGIVFFDIYILGMMTWLA